nr:transporter [Dyella silvatica]
MVNPHASNDPSSDGPPNKQDQADMQTLSTELQTLKASYAQEVRRLRELDMQVQALQARLTGKTGDNTAPALVAAPGASTTVTAADSNQAGSQADASKAEQAPQSRSLQDALQQDHAVFDRKLTIENGVSYAWYDRRQLTLNGFLALDAIFLGNIALQDVKSNTLTYTFAARYGVSPRLTLNLEVPYLGRKTSYFQGGAGGAAAVIAEESTTGAGLGDITLSANYKLFTETESRPDTVLTFGVIAPTGRAPYGISWVAPGGSSGNTADGRFSVPVKQPTGNGLWQTNLGVSAVKTMDPAIIFANLGYIHSFARSFPDIDTDPATKTPGRVKLGDAYYFGAGVAFAFNERTSLSLSFSDKVNGKASLQEHGMPWTKIIGSDANAGSFNLGVTYALSQHTTLVTTLGIGLTPDAPNFMLTFKVPYIF